MESVPPGFVLLNSATQASAKRSEFQAQISFKWRDWAPAICFLLVTPVPSSWNGQGGLAELPPPRVVCWGCKNANRKKRKKSNVFKQVLLSFFFFTSGEPFPCKRPGRDYASLGLSGDKAIPMYWYVIRLFSFSSSPIQPLKFSLGRKIWAWKKERYHHCPGGVCLQFRPTGQGFTKYSFKKKKCILKRNLNLPLLTLVFPQSCS